MNPNAAGSLEDLTALEDGVAGGGGGGGEPGTMGMSAQALKRLENLKIDKLKQIRRPTPPGRGGSNKLPAIPGTWCHKTSSNRCINIELQLLSFDCYISCSVMFSLEHAEFLKNEIKYC